MKNSQINSQEILNLLLESNWDYQYNGWSPDTSKMDSYLSDIEDGLNLEIIEWAISLCEESISQIISEFDETKNNDLSLHQRIAIAVSDTVGQIITGCNSIYHEAVTFTIS